MRPATVLLCLTAVVALGGCESEPDPAPDFEMAETALEVHYTDSSVPPEYHRSWVLTAGADEITVAVDSYGDPIAERTVATPAQVWEDLAADLGEVGDMADAGGEGCGGATSIAVDIESEQRSEHVEVITCSEEGGDRMDRILALLEPVTDAVDLDELTATTD